jgi:UDP-MurNAc hydroxylase
MDWTCLGHAMWLCEAAGLRLLFDPLLGPEHHCGVFETVPRRRVHAEALRPDFVLVSHQHPDHFDVPSLHRLAQLDPDAVVVTPDALVAWAARTLGFRTVHELPAGREVALDGVRLVSTPSLGPNEWGMVIAADGATTWNQVDAVLRNPVHVRQVLDAALPAVDAERVELAIVRWQPMLEIAAVLGRRTAFPHASYADLLAQAAAIGATAVVPGANGAAHVEAFRWLDRFVFPVSEARFLRDVERASPGTAALPMTVGGRYHVMPGEVTLDPTGSAELVTLEPSPVGDPRWYRPFAMPDLRDANPNGHDESVMRPRVHAWIREDLAEALARAYPGMRVREPLRFVVEVVFPRSHDAFTLHVGPDGTHVTETYDDDWDALNAVAGSLLWEVIESRRHWGDVLLAGGLRAQTRAYAVDEQGLHPAEVGETFLYYALSYEAAVERAVRHEVRALVDVREGAPS